MEPSCSLKMRLAIADCCIIHKRNSIVDDRSWLWTTFANRCGRNETCLRLSNPFFRTFTNWKFTSHPSWKPTHKVDCCVVGQHRFGIDFKRTGSTWKLGPQLRSVDARILQPVILIFHLHLWCRLIILRELWGVKRGWWWWINALRDFRSLGEDKLFWVCDGDVGVVGQGPCCLLFEGDRHGANGWWRPIEWDQCRDEAP